MIEPGLNSRDKELFIKITPQLKRLIQMSHMHKGRR
jgi:hypothetical protein